MTRSQFSCSVVTAVGHNHRSYLTFFPSSRLSCLSFPAVSSFPSLSSFSFPAIGHSVRGTYAGRVTHCSMCFPSSTCGSGTGKASSAVVIPYRCFSFGNLFSSNKDTSSTPAPAPPTATTTSSPSSSLLREDAIEPLEDRLLATCVNILEMCGGYADGRPPLKELDNVSRNVLFDLVDAVLHDYNKTPAEQFDLVYAALCLPSAQKYAFLRTPLLTIMECVTPAPLFQFLRGVDVFLPDFDEESIIRRKSLLRFARVLMGDLEFLQQVGQIEEKEELGKKEEDMQGKDGKFTKNVTSSSSSKISEEEVVRAIVEDFKKCFPSAIRVPAFEVLERNALHIALQSKLFALLGRLCMEMDPERTGKIAWKEIDAMARRVLRKEQAASLLDGSEKVVDSEGKIRYRQLCALLSRPPTHVQPPAASAENP